ncbi:hypothetical protein MW887_006029 [Aspergillus wentii]|nr:hypothetical protein MW887_006029 [Aspergillus wentii]
MFRSLLSFGAKRDYIFPTVDPKVDGPDCLKECADCTVHFPSKVKVETSRPLYGGIDEINTHVLVATGKSDWKEKVEHEPGTLMEAFDKRFAKSRYGPLMVSASNLIPADPDSEENSRRKASTVLLLPSFTYVDSVAPTDIPELVDRFIDAPQSQSSDSSSYPNSQLSSRPCQHDYVVLLCSHKRRDARCGITAPLIKKELERHLRPLGLHRDADDDRPGGVGIHFVSHVGGHKFNANVLIYRKQDQQMIWLARVRPEDCEGVVKYTILQGKVVHPETQLRGGFDRHRGLTSW